jgi:hypothetical protein
MATKFASLSWSMKPVQEQDEIDDSAPEQERQRARVRS